MATHSPNRNIPKNEDKTTSNQDSTQKQDAQPAKANLSINPDVAEGSREEIDKMIEHDQSSDKNNKNQNSDQLH